MKINTGLVKTIIIIVGCVSFCENESKYLTKTDNNS